MSYGKKVNKYLIKGLFPKTFQHIKFAFVGEHINRYNKLIQMRNKQKPEFDLIMAVDDVASFHKKNLLENKGHYTYFVRLLNGKPANWLHKFGAKMHFNTIQIPEMELRSLERFGSSSEEELSSEQEDSDDDMYDAENEHRESPSSHLVKFRYGVISVHDMIRDIKFWETLLVSSMLQRPIKRVMTSNKGKYPIWEEYQERNLRSALAYAALTNPSSVTEEQFYQTIVEIPHYESEIGQLLDKEDEVLLVRDHLKEFQKLYRPLIEQHFQNEIRIDQTDGTVHIKNDCSTTRIKLMRHLNDNVYQNIEYRYRGDTKLYANKKEQPSNFKKDPLEFEEKEEIAAEFILKHNLEEQQHILKVTLDKILVTHRNSKIFLFMLSGPFFVLFYCFKGSLKLLIMLLIYGSYKKASRQSEEEAGKAEPKSQQAKQSTDGKGPQPKQGVVAALSH